MYENVSKAAQETRSFVTGDGKIMVDAEFLKEITDAIALQHWVLIQQGTPIDDPRMDGQARVGILLVEFYQALHAKHLEDTIGAVSETDEPDDEGLDTPEE